MITQQKAVGSGERRQWSLDLEAMAQCAKWSRGQRALLEDDVQRISDAFPALVAAVGRPLGEEGVWVEAGEPLLCPDCRDELVVFNQGTRCAACSRPVTPPADAMVGFVGRIPALISGRPFLEALERRIQQLERVGDPALPLYRSSLISVEGRTYLAPRFGLWFAANWPHSPPPVMVWPEYFQVLDIPPDHVYSAPPYWRLCLYARWLEQPAVNVLQRRVVPRLLIDLMMADLQAVDKLDRALHQLEASMYEVYNMIGQTEDAQQLRRVYDALMPPGVPR